VKIVQMGLGPIGIELAQCAERRGHDVVAGVDTDPAKQAQDLGSLLGSGPDGRRVVPELSDVQERADVVIHATGSRLEQVAEQFRMCFKSRLSVVSTCEEAVYPWRRSRELATGLAEEARHAGVALIGAGVNPGFAMDLLPVVAGVPCWVVRSVEVTRVVDAATRRLPLQRKVGVGLTAAEFKREVDKGMLGHVGLAESAWMINDALDLQGSMLSETIEPVAGLASEGTPSVRGIFQTATVEKDGEPTVQLLLTMAAGEQNPRDEIVVDGDPPVHLVNPDGFPGEAATAGIVVAVAERLPAVQPGFRSILDVPSARPPK
jgi:2,4-diaminopentanoate dehydrogenase